MSNTPAGQPDWPEGGTYDIRLRGHLDASWAARLSVSTLTHEGDGTTTLRANWVDQAALHGLLQRVRDLGLTLVSIVRVDATPDDASNSTSPILQRNIT